MGMRLLILVLVLAIVAVGARAYFAARRRERDVRGLPRLPREMARGNATWVVFTSEFCATCGPVKERIRRLDPTADVIDVDVADRPDLARSYRVRTAPTVLFVAANGRVHARFVGNVPDTELAQVI